MASLKNLVLMSFALLVVTPAHSEPRDELAQATRSFKGGPTKKCAHLFDKVGKSDSLFSGRMMRTPVKDTAGKIVAVDEHYLDGTFAQRIKLKSPADRLGFGDLKTFFALERGKKSVILDPKTGREVEIPFQGYPTENEGVVEVIGSSGNFLVNPVTGESVKIPDNSQTGVEREFAYWHKRLEGQPVSFFIKKWRGPIEEVKLPAANRLRFHKTAIVGTDGENQVKFVFAKGPQGWGQVPLDNLGEWKHSTGTSPDGRYLYLANSSNYLEGSNATTRIIDLHSGRLVSSISGLVFPGGSQVTRFTGSERAEVVENSEFPVYRSKDTEIPVVTESAAPWRAVPSRDLYSNEKFQSYRKPDGSLALRMIKEGREIQLPNDLSNIYTIEELPDAKKLVITARTGTYVVDMINGTSEVSSSPRSLFDRKGTLGEHRMGYAERFKNSCLDLSVHVIDDTCKCQVRKAKPHVKITTIPKADSLKQLCEKVFMSQDWDPFTPSLDSGEISNSQGNAYLLRFQKIGGFDPDRHTRILSGILASDLVEKEPTRVVGAMKSIVERHSNLVRKFYTMFDLDKRLPKSLPAKEGFMCGGKVEESSHANFMKNLAASFNYQMPKAVEDWDHLKPFKYEIAKLPKEKADAIVDGIADTLSEGASRAPVLRDLFSSKLYYFAKKHAMSLLGLNRKEATDLTYSQTEEGVRPVVLSSLPLAEHPTSLPPKSRYGFDYKQFEPIQFPKDAKPGETRMVAHQWTTGGEEYSGEVEARVLPPVVPMLHKGSTFPFERLRTDGRLSGLMMVGSNYASHSAWVTDKYISYFERQGFRFLEPRTVDGVEFFKDQIARGETGYFVKEAHSDGDEKNLLRVPKKMQIIEGVITTGVHTSERIILAAPVDKSPGQLISNQQFGEWIRARPGQKPLVYFNGSCNSAHKVINEIQSAHSPNLIAVPTISTVNGFDDRTDNTTRQLIHGFRRGFDYAAMRSYMMSNPNYSKRKEDLYVFPDESDYKKWITDRIGLSIDTRVVTRDRSGREIDFDETIDH